MSTIKLTLDKIQILDKKERWNLYMVMVTDHPTDSSQKLIRTIPDGDYIDFSKKTDNSYSFTPTGGAPGDGLEMIGMSAPDTGSLDVQVFLKNHGGLKKVFDVLEQIKTDLGGENLKDVPGIIGKAASASWVAVAGKSIDVISKVLDDIPDRSLGMLDMGTDLSKLTSTAESFSNKTSKGDAELTWAWVAE